MGIESSDGSPYALLRRQPDPTPARGELVWNQEGAITIAAAQPPREAASANVEDLDPQPLRRAIIETTPAEVFDTTAATLASELARRRAEEFERLDAEMRTRRGELIQSLELRRAEADGRIAESERLEREAIASRRAETDRLWSAEQPGHLAERLNRGLTVELVETRRRYEAAEVELQAELERRRREEAERLETWRLSERAASLAELAAEESHFSDRLMRQLKEFEFQLGERQREHEQRLAQWWEEAEQLARQRVAALLDETLSKQALNRSESRTDVGGDQVRDGVPL